MVKASFTRAEKLARIAMGGFLVAESWQHDPEKCAKFVRKALKQAERYVAELRKLQ